MAQKDEKDLFFSIAIASAGELPAIGNTVALDLSERALKARDEQIGRLELEVVELKKQIQSTAIELVQIKKTIHWKISTAYVFFDYLFPRNSKRRAAVLSFIFFIKKNIHFVQNLFRKNSRKNLHQDEPVKGGVAIYIGSNSQQCLGEVAELLRCGFEEIGMNVRCGNEKLGFFDDVEWHIIIAACEFFFNTPEGQGLAEKLPRNSILFILEQPYSHWYTQIESLFKFAHALWSPDYSTCRLLEAQNYKHVVFMPLGYSAKFNLYKEIPILPNNTFTSFLPDSTKKYSFSHHPWHERPIDITIFCHLTERRNEFFAKNAHIFSKYNCYFVFVNAANGLVVASDSRPPDTETTNGIIQRSKILINIHRSSLQYFEWHRIVMQGVWNKALIISEKCEDGFPFQNGKDYVMCEIEEIADRVDFFLSPKGEVSANEMTSSAYRKLTTQCQISDFLNKNISTFSTKKARDIHKDVLAMYKHYGIDETILRQWSIFEDDWEIIDTELQQAASLKNVLEVGTFMGVSTFCIAQRLINNDQHLYTIDPNALLETEVPSVDKEFAGGRYTLLGRPQDIAKNIFRATGLKRNIHFLQGCLDYQRSNDGSQNLRRWSLDFTKKEMKFDFIFIDANHCADAVYSDVSSSTKILADGGVILLHDGRGRWAEEVLYGICKFLEENNNYTVSRRLNGTILKLERK
ncbi:class I SAM-dependent methyltransferase [Candidatus Uhrbacteria bacterium]|nr:class I SAM-dependent methyltransferase [Candidatus Uhrbacteria bacterium]